MTETQASLGSQEVILRGDRHTEDLPPDKRVAIGGTCEDNSDRRRAESADGTGTQDRMQGHYSQRAPFALPSIPVGTVRWSPVPIGSDELTVWHTVGAHHRQP